MKLKWQRDYNRGSEYHATSIGQRPFHGVVFTLCGLELRPKILHCAGVVGTKDHPPCASCASEGHDAGYR